MKNNWTREIPAVADHPTEKYNVKFLLRLKPLEPTHPSYRPDDRHFNNGTFRTCLAFELGKFINGQPDIPWEFQPLEGSGAFDDGETIDPTSLQAAYDNLKLEHSKLHSILSSARRQAESTLATLNGEY